MTTWMTTREAAQHLRVSLNTLYKLIAEEAVPFHRLGRSYRFLASELDEFLMERVT